MISFDKSIYSADAIAQACKDYKALAKIHSIEKDERIFCDIVDAVTDPELVGDEFCNYVLNLTIMLSGGRN